MKLKSLYEFYRVYFDYPTSGNIQYAKAVAETNRIINQVLITKKLDAVTSFYKKPIVSRITRNLLGKWLCLAEKDYKRILYDAFHFNTIVEIDKNLITSKHRGIQIPIEGAFDENRRDLIVPVYSSNYDIEKEVCVLKGLIKEFYPSNELPEYINTVSYWNLSKGNIATIDFVSLPPANRQDLINAANKIK